MEHGQVAFIGCLELVFQSMLYPGCYAFCKVRSNLGFSRKRTILIYWFAGPSRVCIHRSAYEVKSDGLVLTSGVEVNEDNRPGGPIGDMFWKPAMAMKERITELNLSCMEDSFLRYSILKQDISEAKAKEVLVQYSEKRMKELNEIIAMANSMAINVSRLARYTRRFAEVMDRLGSGNNIGLVITNAPDSEWTFLICQERWCGPIATTVKLMSILKLPRINR